MRKIILEQQDLKEMKKMFNDNVTLREIGEHFGISRTTVKRNLSDMGINTMTRKSVTKYQCQHNIFETIDTEEKAYWLGFIYADGCVYERKNKTIGGSVLIINISEKDVTHIEKFRRFMMASYPIKRVKGAGFSEEKGNTCELRINSTQLVEDLKKHGVVPKKSLTLKPPTTIPKELIKHFIRGYFDGDGSLHKTQGVWGVNFVGTKEVLGFILENLGVSQTLRQRRNDTTKNNYYFSTAGWKKPLKIVRFMYEDATIFLDRKYKAYLEFEQESLNRKIKLYEDSIINEIEIV